VQPITVCAGREPRNGSIGSGGFGIPYTGLVFSFSPDPSLVPADTAHASSVLCSLMEEDLSIRQVFAHRTVLLTWACIAGCASRPEVPRSEPDNSAALSSSPEASDEPCLLGKADPTVPYVPLRTIIATPGKYVGSSVRVHGAFLFERELVSLWTMDGGSVLLDLSGIKASTVSELEACLHKIIAVEGKVGRTRGSTGDIAVLKVTSMSSTLADAGVQAQQSRTGGGDV